MAVVGQEESMRSHKCDSANCRKSRLPLGNYLSLREVYLRRRASKGHNGEYSVAEVDSTAVRLRAVIGDGRSAPARSCSPRATETDRGIFPHAR